MTSRQRCRIGGHIDQLVAISGISGFSLFKMVSIIVLNSAASVIVIRKEVYPDPPSIPEGRWEVYLISLPNRPYSPVTINFVTLTSTITSSPTSLTFEPDLWDVPQELTVIALEDGVNRGDIYRSGFKLALDSEDMNYNATQLPDFDVPVEDNDEGMQTCLARLPI